MLGAKVSDNLFIGSIATAVSKDWLRENKIDCIINLSGYNYECDLPREDIFIDDKDLELADMDDYIREFNHGINYIKIAKSEHKNILVHCAAGINRAVTLICFYLINTGTSAKNAIEIVTAANNARGVKILTNFTFKYLITIYGAIVKFIDP